MLMQTSEVYEHLRLSYVHQASRVQSLAEWCGLSLELGVERGDNSKGRGGGGWTGVRTVGERPAILAAGSVAEGSHFADEDPRLSCFSGRPIARRPALALRLPAAPCATDARWNSLAAFHHTMALCLLSAASHSTPPVDAACCCCCSVASLALSSSTGLLLCHKLCLFYAIVFC
ncbi:hypothetical protein ACOMHN_042031 [Nucella lapillus]